MTHLNFSRTRTVVFTHPIEVPDGEIKVRVEARVYPGCPAIMTYRNGDPGHPAEEPEVEFKAALDGKEYELSEADVDAVTQEAIELAQEDA